MKHVIRSALISSSFKMRGFKPEDAIVLSCDPRSGSTWLSELLVSTTPSAVIWEPFHLDKVPRAREIGFSWRQYIPADADWPEAERFIRDVLTGQVVNEWTGWANPVREFISAQQLIVKCCRANAFLPWMVRRIQFRRRPIHFLRHPFAIAASQIKMGNFGTEKMLETLKSDRYSQDLVESTNYIKGLETDEERIVAMWCRTQKPCLDDPDYETNYVRMYYETLSLDPATEVARLFGSWGETVPEIARDQVQKASRMTQGESLSHSPERQVRKWQEVFTDKQAQRMSRIISDFGITIYDEHPMPHEQKK